MTENNTTLSIGRSPSKTSTMMNLGRSNRYFTSMGWRPVVEHAAVRLTSDMSAVLASWIHIDSPESKELSKGKPYTLALDCTVAPRGNWVSVTPHPDLLALCSVEVLHPMVEPGTEAKVTLVISPRAKMTVEDLPVNCAYLHQYA